MNRENKRKTFEKGYYKTHPCNDTFTRRGPAATTATTAPTAFPACT